MSEKPYRPPGHGLCSTTKSSNWQACLTTLLGALDSYSNKIKGFLGRLNEATSGKHESPLPALELAATPFPKPKAYSGHYYAS